MGSWGDQYHGHALDLVVVELEPPFLGLAKPCRGPHIWTQQRRRCPPSAQSISSMNGSTKHVWEYQACMGELGSGTPARHYGNGVAGSERSKEGVPSMHGGSTKQARGREMMSKQRGGQLMSHNVPSGFLVNQAAATFGRCLVRWACLTSASTSSLDGWKSTSPYLRHSTFTAQSQHSHSTVTVPASYHGESMTRWASHAMVSHKRRARPRAFVSIEVFGDFFGGFWDFFGEWGR